MSSEAFTSRLLSGGFWLYIDTLVNSVTGYVFWLIISKLASVKDIGFATTAFSIAGLLTIFLSLGLVYAVLAGVPKYGGRIYWASLFLGSVACLLGGFPHYCFGRFSWILLFTLGLLF